MSVEERLHELGIELPEPPPPAGNYIGAVSVGNLLFLSGLVEPVWPAVRRGDQEAASLVVVVPISWPRDRGAMDRSGEPSTSSTSSKAASPPSLRGV